MSAAGHFAPNGAERSAPSDLARYGGAAALADWLAMHEQRHAAGVGVRPRHESPGPVDDISGDTSAAAAAAQSSLADDPVEHDVL